MRRRKNDTSGVVAIAFIFGIPLFLLMNHPIIFFLVFIPAVALLIFLFIKWLKK